MPFPWLKLMQKYIYQIFLLSVLYFLVAYFVISEEPISGAIDMKSEVLIFKFFNLTVVYILLLSPSTQSFR